MSVVERVEAYTAALSWTAIGLLALGLLALFVRWCWQSSWAARDDARVEAEFADTLAWVRSVRVGSSAAGPVVSHRARQQLPNWLRSLAARGARREPAGYGPPPPLTSEPVARADWSVADRNTVPALLNPAVGAASVRRQGWWEEVDVIGHVLGGRMEAAANSEDTALIEPVRAEVVR